MHTKVHALASKLVYGLELAKLARYSAGFSPQGRLNFLFLHLMQFWCQNFSFFPLKGYHNNNIVGYKYREAPGSPSPAPEHHKHLPDNQPCALHTHPSPAQLSGPRSSPWAPSAPHSPWEQLHPGSSTAQRLFLRGEGTFVGNLQLRRSASVASFPDFKKDFLVQFYLS